VTIRVPRQSEVRATVFPPAEGERPVSVSACPTGKCGHASSQHWIVCREEGCTCASPGFVMLADVITGEQRLHELFMDGHASSPHTHEPGGYFRYLKR
jgi:hypothetical protein